MTEKRNSKWRPQPSCIDVQWLFLTYFQLSTVELNQHAKFHANISVHNWIIITFWNSRWQPSGILDFRKPRFWPLHRVALDCWFSITIPNLVQKCWSTPKLWPKIEMQDGGRPPSWICETSFLTNVPLPTDFPSVCQIWCKNMDRRPNYGPQSKYKITAVRHVEFSKSWFLTNDQWPYDVDFLPGYQIWCKNVDRHPNYGLKSKLKMAAVDHLEIVKIII